MSKTGTYKIVNGDMVKVSDRIPWVSFDHVSLPKGQGYFSRSLGREIRSRRQKRDILARRGLAEVGDGRSSDFVRQPRETVFGPEDRLPV